MISIVIPVYNVEKYLRKCLNSIINQTYKNFEVILVDDGSTDGSGRICDEYALQIPYMKVLHKENGGLSDARNYGVSFAKGEYITFIDSDDYVDICYIEKMQKALSLDNVDMVVVGQIDENENGNALRRKGSSCNCMKIMTSEEALKEMCYEDKFGTSAWGKLYYSNYVKENPFPKGKIYEDLATIYRIIGCSQKIAFINTPLYHYVQRVGSIRNSGWKKEVLDIMDASLQLLNYVREKFPNIETAAVYRYFFSANEVYVRAFEQKKYLDIISQIEKDLREMWPMIRKNNLIRKRQKTRYYFMAYHPLLYKLMWKIAKCI